MAAYSVTDAMVAWIASLGYASAARRTKHSPVELVTVQRTGGGAASMVDHPMMAVQTWARTEGRAEEMANAVKLALLTTRPPRGIHSVRANTGPYPFFDEDTRCPRYQFVLDVASQLSVPD
jgi:hypothetical protein